MNHLIEFVPLDLYKTGYKPFHVSASQLYLQITDYKPHNLGDKLNVYPNQRQIDDKQCCSRGRRKTTGLVCNATATTIIGSMGLTRAAASEL